MTEKTTFGSLVSSNTNTELSREGQLNLVRAIKNPMAPTEAMQDLMSTLAFDRLETTRIFPDGCA